MFYDNTVYVCVKCGSYLHDLENVRKLFTFGAIIIEKRGLCPDCESVLWGANGT